VDLRSFWRWLTTKRTDLGMLSVAFPKASEKEKDTKLQKDRIRCLSLVERARMEAAAGPRWQPFFSSLYHTGLRVSEMQALAWGNLQLDGERPELLVEVSISRRRAHTGGCPRRGQLSLYSERVWTPLLRRPYPKTRCGKPASGIMRRLAPLGSVSESRRSSVGLESMASATRMAGTWFVPASRCR
jgi:integrase